jgi:nitroreductase
MDVFSAISERRSVRDYLETEIEHFKLTKILEAARLSPSAKNLQEWKFIVVRDAAIRKRLAEAANGQTFAGTAPVIVVACGTAPQYIMPCGQYAYPIDVSIACTHMVLQACELGIGSCWLGAFNEAEVKRILNIPDNARVVAMIPFGYPARQVPARLRKSLGEIVTWDKYK